jgi:argininosuccinate synthase
MFLAANAIGGKHGIGMGTHLVENRFVGIKSRGVYEGPGIELLGTAYMLLLQLILDRRSREFFDQVSLLTAKQIYQGYWFDLTTQMARKCVDHIAELVTGTVTVSLYKGNILFQSVTDAPHSLYSEENASMEGIGEYNHADSEGFLRVLGVSARTLATHGQVM